MKCVRCSSYAINHNSHDRDGSDPDLCDVCYWRKRCDHLIAIVKGYDMQTRELIAWVQAAINHERVPDFFGPIKVDDAEAFWRHANEWNVVAQKELEII
jgi:hypothetical protein